MEQSKALQALMESADLLHMLEDIIAIGAIDKISPASLSGMRVTMKRVRKSILSSHDALASDLIARSKSQMESQSITKPLRAGLEVEREQKTEEATQSKRDLRATIEQAREQLS